MTPFDLLQRLVGEIKEQPGAVQHPFIQWSLSLCGFGFDAADEVPWCSAILNAVCWLLRAARSGSAAARSWMGIGHGVELVNAIVGWDVVVLMRGTGKQPGPDVINAPGHVGLFAGLVNGGTMVEVLAGNQHNEVSIQRFPVSQVLGVRRLSPT